MTHTATPRSDELGTVGQLSRRTGIPIKAIRDYTDHGPVNTRGRSAAGYRTYTSEALWCLQFITTLRGLGLTLAEIRGQTHPHPQPPGPRLADLLIASRRRIDERVAALKAKTRHGERPTGLHDDQRCEVRDSRVTLTAWIALVDVPVERGALTFLPGRTAAADPNASTPPSSTSTTRCATTNGPTCSTTGQNWSGCHASRCHCEPVTPPSTIDAPPTRPAPTTPPPTACRSRSPTPTPTRPSNHAPATTGFRIDRANHYPPTGIRA